MRFTFVFLLPLALYGQSDAGLSQGRGLFRGNCAFCHGLTAEGGRGPNLVSAPLHHGETDEDIKTVIRKGVPGTTMPEFSGFANEEVDNLVLYLRSLSKTVEKRKPISGDVQQGRQLYAKNGCESCHRVGNQGSVYGPDLTRIGAARPVEYLRESIVHPTADIQPDYEGVTAVTRAGKRVTGIRINEDTFTLQLRTMDQKIVSYSKEDLKEVVYEKKSLMPAYERLAPTDLNNLLAYLASLQGSARGTTKEAEGVR